MALTFKINLDNVKMNQHVKYLGGWSLPYLTLPMGWEHTAPSAEAKVDGHVVQKLLSRLTPDTYRLTGPLLYLDH